MVCTKRAGLTARRGPAFLGSALVSPKSSSAPACPTGRVPYRMARRGVVRKSREWVLEKKERHRRQGKEVRPDTQYTGRKSKPRF